jgi:hypothetical protein
MTPDAVVAAVETVPPAPEPAVWTGLPLCGLAPESVLATFCATLVIAEPALEPTLETA